jgi:hypothetical protein
MNYTVGAGKAYSHFITSRPRRRRISSSRQVKKVQEDQKTLQSRKSPCTTLATMVLNNYTEAQLEESTQSPWLKNTSIGTALTDSLDAFITDGRMEPQVALKVLATFDRVVAEVLAEKVKARLSFKVRIFHTKEYAVLGAVGGSLMR